MNITALRAATPGCARITHFNHSGASLPCRATLAAIKQQLDTEAESGPQEAAAALAGRLDEIRARTAQLLNAAPADIAFTSSAAASWGMAWAALPPLQAGQRVLVGRHEWGGNLATVHAAAERAGARVEVIPCDDDGSVSPSALARMLDAQVRLVALTWLPANGGLVNPAVEIGQLCRAAGVPCFIDAGQALGQMPVDVEALRCDVLVGVGRKYLRGPRGVSLLYVRPGFLPQLQPSYLDVLSAPWGEAGPALRADARRFETGESSPALLLGFGVAIDTALALGLPAIQARIAGLAHSLRSQLAEVKGVQMLDLGRTRSSIVAFNLAGQDANAVRLALAARGINVAAHGRAYTPLDMDARGLTRLVRASVSYLNTDDEVTRLVQAVEVLALR